MNKFGNIPTTEKSIMMAVIEVVSQRIMEETNEKLAKANAKLLMGIERYNNYKRSVA